MRHIERNIPEELDVHLVVDNYATHKHAKVKNWLAKRPRFHVHFTPTYASWLNQVERWFGIITQRAIRRGSFKNVGELTRKIDDFVTHYNEHARPFVWTATAVSVLAKPDWQYIATGLTGEETNMSINIITVIRSITVSIMIAGTAACTYHAGIPDTADTANSATSRRPNILLIVADDLGYTDLGAFGGEIDTPNLDALVHAGVQLTNFHTAATCSPTRAMLLSGTDHHLAGLGSMASWMETNSPEMMKNPGYEGYLNFRVASLANLMQNAGYKTYMTGKWHLGLEEATSPAARGFDRSFALLHGGGGHFSDLGLFGPKAKYRKDGKLTQLPEDFYSTRFFTEEMIKYIRQGRENDNPFFAHLSYTAPHWPLQAPEASITKYHGRYDEGYEVLFNRRVQRLKELGFIEDDVELPPLLEGQPHWNDLTEKQKRRQARIMEIYAAMIEDVDKYVGRLIQTLKDMGEYENTVIFFMSDNGAEGGTIDRIPTMREWVEQCCDNSYANMGRPDSYLMLGPNWARASIGASRLFKTFTTEGGIQSPAFITYPGDSDAGRRYDGFVSVMDVLPTFLELAGTQPPNGTYRGRKVLPVKGASFATVLHEGTPPVHEADYGMGWELFGNQAYRKGDWKIVRTRPPYGDGEWGLFNLARDPGEMHDLSEQYPEKFGQLLDLWQQYVKDNGVLPVPQTGVDW